jgi:2,5-diamino-6-(ribosylamino)-4(3H)-pyrimidinone 5'-phosphate reductase
VDGKIATAARRRARLSSDADMERVRALRASCDAIMVGVGTVLSDDPSLLAPESAPHPLLRVVVDSKGRSPATARVFDGKAPTLLATTRNHRPRVPNADVLQFGEGRVDLVALVEELGRRGVRRLMVEGGGTLIFALFERALVDELFVFVADVLVGGAGAPTVADGPGFEDLAGAARLRFEEAKRMAGGTLLRYTVPARA